MTLKHRLARTMAPERRNSLLAAAVCAAVAAGCSPGELKGGFDPPPSETELVSITTSPASISVPGDSSVGFQARGLDSSGNAVSVSVTWAATGGTIQSSGQYVATAAPGVYLVIATGPSGLLADTSTVTIIDAGGPAPPPPPPPGGADLTLSFDDPSNLGLNCAGGVLDGFSCPDWSTSGYRKHSYLPAGGANSTGAINMHWFTDMSIGFSPLWVDPVPHARHFHVRYAVKQTAAMIHSGSAQKLHRIRSDNTFIGTLESKQGGMYWYWEAWTSNDPVSAFYLGIPVPTDSQWHIYEFELDYTNLNDMVFTFWLDGTHVKTLHMASRVGDMMAGHQTLTFSPFTEMYSCGDSGACSANINTGDYTVDDFSFTALP